jgi:predicted dithiol-disulfide oxidoreductase (DUF899 family)
VKGDRGDICHTYSTYRRGAELLVGARDWLDPAPEGHNESTGPISWARLRDEY